jgi:hypothetical protein
VIPNGRRRLITKFLPIFWQCKAFFNVLCNGIIMIADTCNSTRKVSELTPGAVEGKALLFGARPHLWLSL